MRSIVLITARLGSSRLPGKMLAHLRGRSVLQVLVERLRLAERPDGMLLATTQEPEDDALEVAARALGVDVFRGETHDVLMRWFGAAEAVGADLLICCDGDDIFCDAGHVDRVIGRYAETKADYITCEGLPFGTAPTGVARAGLARVCARKQETDTEGQGRFFNDSALVRRDVVLAPPTLRHDTARMTLDYPEDLRFAEAVLDGLAGDGPSPSLERIVAFLHEHPEVVGINASLQAEYWARFNARYPPVTLTD